jgi:uncharacterized membrane protein
MAERRRHSAPVFAALLLLYPFAVYFGLQQLSPRLLGALLLALLALRWLLLRRRLSGPVPGQLYLPLAVGAACALAALAFDRAGALRLLPAAINGVCLLGFGYTLLRPPSMIERFARAWDPAFPESAVGYTRAVTVVWCGFFLLNGAAALYTGLAASLAVWALYNGLLAYLLMGALFGGEWLLRRRLQAAR